MTGNAEVIPRDPIRAITSGLPTIQELADSAYAAVS